MATKTTHDLHRRRFSRNLGVGLCLGAFVAVLFGLSMAKVARTGAVEGFDHAVRPAMAEGGQ